MRSKRAKHKEIIKESLEEVNKGYSHRRHRKSKPTGSKCKLKSIKKDKLEKEKDEEWKKMWINKGEIYY